MEYRFSIRILFIAALLIAGSTQVSAEELYQKVTSLEDIDVEDEYAICQVDGEYALKGTEDKPFATSKPSKTNMINNLLLSPAVQIPDGIKLIPVEGEANTYYLQFTASGEFIQGGTGTSDSTKDLKRVKDDTYSRIKWTIELNNNGVTFKNTATGLYICNSTTTFSCNKTKNTKYSYLFKKISKEGDIVVTKH